MRPLTEEIFRIASALPEGEPLQAKALLHLGNRAAIDQSLSRLVQRGQLTRAGRGVYLTPVETRFGTRTPEPGKVVEAIARSSGETIASSGATAANALGLTTQVPVRMVYLTSGKSRTIALGPRDGAAMAPAPIEVELRHAPRWQLVLAGRPAGEVIRAIAWAAGENGPRKPGPPSTATNTSRARAAEATLRQVLGRLPSGALEELAKARPSLPSWIAEPVSRVMVHG